MNRLAFLAIAAVVALGVFFFAQPTKAGKGAANQDWPAHLQSERDSTEWKVKEKTYWSEVLDGETYRVCRESGTERPWSSTHNHTKDDGVFHCSSCGQALFSVDAKFDSGTGWPSFSAPIVAEAVSMHTDDSFGMARTEVKCGRCDAHLGHVFKDGPKPTGERWCINGVCLLHRGE